MPNWKKVIVSGSDAILSSVTASFTGSLTGALIGTSSWATNATQAHTRRISIDGTAYVVIVDSDNTSPTAEILYTPTNVTINPARGSLTATSVTSSFTGSLTGSVLGSASYALTASYALNGGGGAAFPYTGSAIISSSLVITGSLQVGVPGTNAGAIDTNLTTLSRGSTTSVNWANRELYDSTGTLVTLNWESRQLFSNANNTIIDWESSTISSPNYVALEYSSDQYTNSQLYSRQTIPESVQESVTNTPSFAGQIISASVTAADYELVSLDIDGVWKGLKATVGYGAEKMLGMCVDAAGGYVLLEGDVGVSDDNSQGTYVIGADHGLPVYITTTQGELSTTAPTVANSIIRVVGHIYYRSANDTNHWLMKFRPSNDYYQT